MAVVRRVAFAPAWPHPVPVTPHGPCPPDGVLVPVQATRRRHRPRDGPDMHPPPPSLLPRPTRKNEHCLGVPTVMERPLTEAAIRWWQPCQQWGRGGNWSRGRHWAEGPMDAEPAADTTRSRQLEGSAPPHRGHGNASQFQLTRLRASGGGGIQRHGDRWSLQFPDHQRRGKRACGGRLWMHTAGRCPRSSNRG